MVDAAIAIGPTRERIKQAAWGIDGPEVSQKVDRRAHAVRDIWADLKRRQQIDKVGEDAGRRFARHLELAYRGRSVTQSYGQRQAEGTPASQLSSAADEDEAIRHVDYVQLHGRAREAMSATPRLAILMACDGKTLEQIGRLVSRYKGEKATAAAVMAVGIGLESLAVHYRMKIP